MKATLRLPHPPFITNQLKHFGFAFALMASLLIMPLASQAEQMPVNWGTLNLNADQSSKFNQLEEQWENTAEQLMPQIEKDKAELAKLMSSPNSDSNRIMQLQNRIATNKLKLQNVAMQTFLKKKEQLNDNQKKMLQNQMQR